MPPTENRARITMQESFHCGKLSPFKIFPLSQYQLLYALSCKQGNKCLGSGFNSQEILMLSKFSLTSLPWALPSIWPGGSSELLGVLLSHMDYYAICLFGILSIWNFL